MGVLPDEESVLDPSSFSELDDWSLSACELVLPEPLPSPSELSADVGAGVGELGSSVLDASLDEESLGVGVVADASLPSDSLPVGFVEDAAEVEAPSLPSLMVRVGVEPLESVGPVEVLSDELVLA